MFGSAWPTCRAPPSHLQPRRHRRDGSRRSLMPLRWPSLGVEDKSVRPKPGGTAPAFACQPRAAPRPCRHDHRVIDGALATRFTVHLLAQLLGDFGGACCDHDRRRQGGRGGRYRCRFMTTFGDTRLARLQGRATTRSPDIGDTDRPLRDPRPIQRCGSAFCQTELFRL